MSALPPSLVVTKLLVPRVPAGLVARPRLMDKLAGALYSRLTLVSAPPGFGKTALLADWLDRADPKPDVGWVSLDESDNDPTRFWAYVIAAGRAFGADVGGAAQALLQTAQPPLEAVLGLLVNDLAALPAGRRLIVLDDYHAITLPRIHETLAYFLDRLPAGLGLVVATRADPPLPLARLRVRGQLTEIRAADLRFTDAEAASLVAGVASQPVAPASASALAARTEGWAAGLQLAALSLQGVSDVDAFVRDFTGSHRYVFDYLAEEVLSRLPESDRTFLLETSILESLGGPLCDALTGRPDGQATLRRLEQANLFLIPLDQARQWYRYHHLFAYFLRAQLEAERDPAAVVALHRRAADWLADEGLLGRAVEHYLQCGDEARAAGLVDSQAAALFARNELHTIVAWARRLSAGSLAARPSLGLATAWALLATGQPDEAESRLQAVERHFGVAGRSITDPDFDRLPTDARAALVEIGTVRCSLALAAWDIARLFALTQAILPHLVEDDQPYIFSPVSSLKPVVLFDLGLAHEFAGSLASAAEAFAEAARRGGGGGNPHIPALALSHLAAVQVASGLLTEAMATYRVADATKMPGGLRSPLTAVARAGLGALLVERGDFETAEGLLDEASADGRLWNNAESLALAHFGLARLRRATGDLAGAERALRDLASHLDGPASLAHGPAIRAFAARLSLDRGDLAAAERWAKESAPRPDDPVAAPRFAEHTTLARVLTATERFAEAQAVLDRCLAASEPTGRIGQTIETLVLLALLQQARGQSSVALATLGRALALGEAAGYRQAFRDEGPALAALLREAARRGIARCYAAALLAEAEPPAVSGDVGVPPAGAGRSGQTPHAHRPAAVEFVAAPRPLVEPLTDREREVLGLVVAGRSNVEIADALVVSVGTVKTHTHNLYAKLGVATRTAAIARARELGLG